MRVLAVGRAAQPLAESQGAHLLIVAGSVPESGAPIEALKSIADAFASRLQDDRPRHLRYLRSRLASPEDAEDALQDATIKMLRRAQALTTIEKLDAWVSVALRHTVIDRYRRSAAQRRLIEALVAEPKASSDPDEDSTLTTTLCLTDALPRLKPTYTVLLQLIYLQGMALKDAATLENLTRNNAAVRLHRARNALRTALMGQCQACPLNDCWARQRSVPAHPLAFAGLPPAITLQ